MQWLTENWVLLVLLGGCIGMHLFMHGHHSHSSMEEKGDTKNVPKRGIG